jgi:glycosyltransferase involved in cell wall biosynthesis
LKYLFHRFKPKRGLKNYLTHAPLRMADRLVALSSHDREVLIKLGVKPEKIAIIPNAIDPDWHTGVEPAHKSHDEMRVLFLGQFKYRKGFDLLVKAMPAVIKRFPEARFIFPGHSPVHKDDLLQLLDEGGVRGYAQLPGFVSEREKAALFLSSEVYVLPTRYEGFGIPLIEAMSAGCPVVSSDIPVINEIIKDGQTGLLFEYNNHEKLAEVLVHILENPLLRHKLAENGRREAEKYYTPRVIKQLEALYREACGLPALPNSAGIKSL